MLLVCFVLASNFLSSVSVPVSSMSLAVVCPATQISHSDQCSIDSRA